MALPQEIGRATFGDMTAIWYDYTNHAILFALVPTAKVAAIANHREYLDKDDAAHKGNCVYRGFDHAGSAIAAESCLQLHFAADQGEATNSGSFAAGLTLRGSPCSFMLAFQKLEVSPDSTQAVLTFRDDVHGLEARQCYSYTPGQRWITVNTTLTNIGNAPRVLEYLASFSLGMLSPFQPAAGADCYTLLEWHSDWAGEGRLEERHIEDAGLEQSWNSYGLRLRRIGATTSMPVHGFYPQMGFADNEARVVWGASLESYGTWQLQLSRNGDYLTMDGGLPDKEFNGWSKELAPGESFSGICAALTCAVVPERGTAAETLCNRLAPFAGSTPENINSTEAGVPALFNDWCMTWGAPYQANLRPVLERLRSRGVAYLNMDYGWFQAGRFGENVKPGEHRPEIGDWLPYPAGPEYPEGFGAWLEEIRSAGMKPGVWFEFENAVKASLLLKEHPDWFLTLDGRIINDGLRHFLDFRKPEVTAYLKERVIDFLRENKIGYMKVDYNAPIGARCDGPAASQAENFRQALEANVEFYRLLRKELPELTLEICASGGYRTSAGWMRIAAIASSSDAHEGVEIPLLAANTSMLIASRNNQIWSTLHEWDDENRLLYSLAGACIGRLCLSGDVQKLSEAQMTVVDAALAYYEQCKALLPDGDSFIQRRLKSRSYITPKGAQLYLRRAATGERLSAILHTFGDCERNSSWTIDGRWRLTGTRLASANTAITAVLNGDGTTTLSFQGMPDFSAAAIMLAAL